MGAHSQLAPSDERVPRAGAQGIDVNAGAGAPRAHQEPAVGRPPPVAHQTEYVLPKVLGNVKMLQESFGLPVAVEVCVENVQRAIVVLLINVLCTSGERGTHMGSGVVPKVSMIGADRAWLVNAVTDIRALTRRKCLSFNLIRYPSSKGTKNGLKEARRKGDTFNIPSSPTLK